MDGTNDWADLPPMEEVTAPDAQAEVMRLAGLGEDDDASGIETPDPWPDPVEGASLAEEIRARLGAYVVLVAAGDVDAATILIFGSYLMPVLRLWLRQMITSPTKQCGKSTLLEMLDALVQRGSIAANARSGPTSWPPRSPAAAPAS
ncbi:MAG: hypothetical protein ACXIVG_02970 [Pararhodobacter sp.]